MLAVYRDRGLWGAVPTSKFAGRRFRAAVYRTLRELVMSYFDDYYNWDGERTLRAFSRPVALARFDRISWMSSEADLWPIVERLAVVPHVKLISGSLARRLPGVDARSYKSGILGAPGD